MQNFSFHTHTNTFGLFDGHNSISEMIEAAQKAGYKELGISNHLIYHHNMHTSSEAQKNGKMFHADKQKAKEIMTAVVEEIREKAKTAPIKHQFMHPFISSRPLVTTIRFSALAESLLI